jgi:RNA-binding protein YlmH
MNKTELLKSIKNEDERILYARALDKAAATLKLYEPQFTDFTDPFKMGTLCDIVHKEYGFSLNTMVWGGFAEAERRTLGFFPDYTEPTPEDFPISCVEISYNSKFSRELTHRDFLGSVLGLGINREKTGDILIEPDRAYMFADKEVASFICANLERVGHTKVKVSLLDSYTPEVKEGTEKRITVTSLRLDALLCGAFNLSRGKVADLIKGEKAFINWIPVTNGAKLVSQGDTLTLRGCGRVVLKELQGITKKERYAVVLEIFK